MIVMIETEEEMMEGKKTSYKREGREIGLVV